MRRVTAGIRRKAPPMPCARCEEKARDRWARRCPDPTHKVHVGRCDICHLLLNPGDEVRTRFWLDGDCYQGPPVTVAHEVCCFGRADWDLTETVSARAARRARDQESLRFIAARYGTVLTVGQRVSMPPGAKGKGRRIGRVVRADGHVYVKLRGERVHPWHPNDIKPAPPVRSRRKP